VLYFVTALDDRTCRHCYGVVEILNRLLGASGQKVAG
jgi:hypothetical protein